MKHAALYLVGVGRVIKSDHEPPEWFERYDSIAEMRQALIAPDGSEAIFRAALSKIADELDLISRDDRE